MSPFTVVAFEFLIIVTFYFLQNGSIKFGHAWCVKNASLGKGKVNGKGRNVFGAGRRCYLTAGGGISLGGRTYRPERNIRHAIHEGKLKNRRIYSPDTYTRPMMSKVKESLFSILSHLGIFSNSTINVLDVFSGSGNLGIECISRDIPHVTFVDLSLNSCKTIYENLKLCNINYSYNQIIRADAMELLKCPLKFHMGQKFHLAFFTPPYEQIVYSELIQNISNSELFHPDCLVFIEYPKEIEMLPQRVYNMIGLRNRKFGRTYFALYVLNSSGKYLFAERRDEFYPLHYNRKQRRQEKYL
ncbi:methylase [Plasmodium cynomolgi strain B]|uniref:Methylase n=1 Tax=Plasmodium cynomolgi (strain B) TaxID=1120755 RepID=K6VE88_PLACD|nr:methylase [Plasmodium cynomolgi strain B]GAB67562.1 methylase [Plasmodium cynomolgi strain B]